MLVSGSAVSPAAIARHVPALPGGGFDPDFEYIQGAPSALHGAIWTGSEVEFQGMVGGYAEWDTAAPLVPGTYAFTSLDTQSMGAYIMVRVGGDGAGQDTMNADGLTYEGPIVVPVVNENKVRISDPFGDGPVVASPSLKRIS